MSVPIDSHGRAVAAMFVAGRRTQGYARADARLFDSLSRRIATALENARLYRQTQTLAVLQERERISREIHDGLAQAFSALNLRVNMLARLLEPGQSDTARQEVHEIGQMVEHAYKDLRDVILGLRTSPATGSGFISSLSEYVGKFSRQSGVQAHLVEPDQEITLSAAIEVQLIRIIQEALTNVRKHAPGSHAWLRFKGGEGTMQVAIEDDGPGFDPAAVAQDGQPHYGLQTMRERALSVGGELQLETAPGQGTKVTVTVPMSEPRRDA